MNRSICSPSLCSACKACAVVCPQHCIRFATTNASESTFAEKDLERCSGCGACEKVCPRLNGCPDFHAPTRCYAAWSMDGETRRTSASGGVATELYRHVLAAGGKIVGAAFDTELRVALRLSSSSKDLHAFQNSKYVYSDPKKIYSEVRQELKRGVPVAFVGLPCQVAGLLSYLRAMSTPCGNLLAVDLVCHGTAPAPFFLQHVACIAGKKHRTGLNVCFRNPRGRTMEFHFTVSDGSGVFYDKVVADDDVYQIGYHQGIIYRDNCYRCPYACAKRVGDLTLGDFHAGLGKCAPCAYGRENVSCVLANTEKGAKILAALQESRKLFLEERPLNETLAYEPQLRHPTRPPPEREVFLRKYAQSGDFVSSMRKAARKIIATNRAKKFFRYQLLKGLLLRGLPQPLLKALRGFLSSRRSRHAEN